MKPKYIKASAVKKLIKENGKRTSNDFIEHLDRFVHMKILESVDIHNGGKKTVDRSVAGFILGNR